MVHRTPWTYLAVVSLPFVVLFQNCSGQFKSMNDPDQSSEISNAVGASLSVEGEGAKIPQFFSESESSEFPLKGDCKADDTEALRAFFKKGGLLRNPAGGCYLVSDTILVPSNIQVRGEGASTLIKLRVPMGSSARPVLDFAGSGSRNTENIHVSNLAIDAGGEFMNQVPVHYNGNIGYGNAILVQSSNSSVSDVWIKNAWDNGVGFYQLGCISENNPNQQCNGQPMNVSAIRIQCENSGIGERSKQLGACVNALTSRNTLIADSIDQGSSTGFTVDYWGGASATLRNLKTYNNKIAGFWIGSPNVTIENVESHGVSVRPSQLANETAGHGMVIERFAANRGALGQVTQVGRLKNFKSTNADRNGLVIAASGWNLANIEIVDPNRSNQRYVGVLGLVNVVEMPGTPIGISNTSLVNVRVRSGSGGAPGFDYGYDEQTRNLGCISIDVVGGDFVGRVRGKSERSHMARCASPTQLERETVLEYVIGLFKTYLYRSESEIQMLKQNPQSGLFYYTDLLMGGTARSVVENEIRGSDEAFVKSKFLEIFGRLPLKTEFEPLFAKLKSGQSRSQIENEIKAQRYYPTLESLVCDVRADLGSLEGQRLVLGIFKERFERCPREAGLKYWVGIFDGSERFKASGALEKEIILASRTSGELEFVKSLCRDGDSYVPKSNQCQKK